jgi:hypothetical protein
MPIRMLSRDEHLKLSDTDLELFKSLQRRDQLPTMADEHKEAKGWSPTESMLLNIANQIAGGPASSRELARDIAASCFGPIYERYVEIAESSEQLAEGKTPKSEILAGAFTLPPNVKVPKAERGRGLAADLIIFAGTFAEIAERYPSALQFVGVNVSRVAAGMRLRAQKFGIDLGDYWSYRAPSRARK